MIDYTRSFWSSNRNYANDLERGLNCYFDDMQKKLYTIIDILIVILILIVIYMLFFKKNNMADVVDLNDISEINIRTQMTSPLKELDVPESEYDGLIELLKKYKVKEIHREIPKGWQYNFKIKTKSGENISILFQGSDTIDSNGRKRAVGRVVINDKYYNVYGYSPNDFLYLFENK